MTRATRRDGRTTGGYRQVPLSSGLHDELRRRGEGIGLTTVYRTLQSLAADGVVDALRTDNGESVYGAARIAVTAVWCAGYGLDGRGPGRSGRGVGRRDRPRARIHRRQPAWRSSGICSDCVAHARTTGYVGHFVKGQGEAAAATVVVAAASVGQMSSAVRVERVVSTRVSLKCAGWLPQDGPSNRS